MELHNPQDFHEAVMYAEGADAMIMRVSGHNMWKSWQKGYKGGPQQRPQIQVKSSGGETNAQGSGGLEPMELGVAWRRTLSDEGN